MALIFVAPIWGGAVRGQESWEMYQIGAVKVDQAPEIDGRLDETVWTGAAVIDSFIQQEPLEGEPATERTEVRVMYDSENLFVGIFAFVRNSDGVIATEMRRDADRILEEDNFQIILDTFMDSRSGYMFVTNPLGAKLDQQVAEEGDGGRRGQTSNVNRDWDGVWHVATRRVPNGWTAEIAIPFVTLSFPERSVQNWGINFMRNIRRKNEQVFWAPIPKEYTLTRVSLAGTLRDMDSLNQGNDLRVTPFVLGGGTRAVTDGVTDDGTQQEVGLDLKYGVTAGLNLDVTINTDFAQAEVDDEQVNLTRFSLRYPEKRDFFLENAGYFNVGARSNNQQVDLFFSRRIGLSERGEPVPILGGARLTGKVGDHNIAVMDLQTDESFGGPGENFLVTRYSQDVLSRSRVGGIFINKEESGGSHFNRTMAVDMNLVPHPALVVNGFVGKTTTEGLAGRDYGGHVRAEWLDRSWNLYAEFTRLGENFNPEVGFVTRRGGGNFGKYHFEWNPRPGRYGIRLLEPMINFTYNTDVSGLLLTRRWHKMLRITFESGGSLNLWHNQYHERLIEPFRVRRNVEVSEGSYSFGEWRFSYTSDPSRMIYVSGTYAPQGFFDGTRTDYDASIGIRATNRLAMEGRFVRNDVNLPGGNFTVDIGGLRVDYALSPDVSIRTYTQYNSSVSQWSTSARFRFTFRPGSDVYVVYDEVRRDPTASSAFVNGQREHQLLIKVTYLWSL